MRNVGEECEHKALLLCVLSGEHTPGPIHKQCCLNGENRVSNAQVYYTMYNDARTIL